MHTVAEGDVVLVGRVLLPARQLGVALLRGLDVGLPVALSVRLIPQRRAGVRTHHILVVGDASTQLGELGSFEAGLGDDVEHLADLGVELGGDARRQALGFALKGVLCKSAGLVIAGSAYHAPQCSRVNDLLLDRVSTHLHVLGRLREHLYRLDLVLDEDTQVILGTAEEAPLDVRRQRLVEMRSVDLADQGHDAAKQCTLVVGM